MNEDEIMEIRNTVESLYRQPSKSPDKDRRITAIDNEDGLNKQMNPKIFIRNQFSRDKDRILFSRSFRRLIHKAQVFSHERGDHYRTRLTHTLEVAQIARSISRNLGLNEDLVEAISLGHDIGHTPFGHQGERVLDEILSGKDDLGGLIEYKIDYSGFKHNVHSLKVLDKLEKKHKDIPGLNLTWQILEGILKHTNIKRNKIKCDKCPNKSGSKCLGSTCENVYDLSKNLNDPSMLKEFLDYPDFSVTLEGQVVALSDEIAQRQHDLDDGLRDINLKLSYDNMCKIICLEIGKISEEIGTHERLGLLSDLKEKIGERNNKYKEEIKENERYLGDALVRDVIDYFIKDLTISSMENIINKASSLKVSRDDKIYFKGRIIEFSPIGKKFCQTLENYIRTLILNSYEVNRFDGKANFIIKQLFKAYYTNPRQMPSYMLHHLSEKIEENCKNIQDISYINEHGEERSIKEINFDTSKAGNISELLNILKLNNNIGDLMGKYCNCYKNIYVLDEREHEPEYLYTKCLIENHFVYLSTICDYIAGMTDNFAKEEYDKLYLV